MPLLIPRGRGVASTHPVLGYSAQDQSYTENIYCIMYICTAEKQRMEGDCTDKNMFVEISKYDIIEMFIY